MEWLAKVNLGKTLLTYKSDYVWYGEGEDGDLLAMEANILFGYPNYRYSESDGRPGWLVANRLAAKMKGKVELNPETDKP